MSGWAEWKGERYSTGYERTLPGRRTYGSRTLDRAQTVESTALVLGERFVVKVSGSGSSVEELRAAVASLDLSGLEALKNEGVASN